jgi:hypothetical protein
MSLMTSQLIMIVMSSVAGAGVHDAELLLGRHLQHHQRRPEPAQGASMNDVWNLKQTILRFENERKGASFSCKDGQNESLPSDYSR